MAVLTASQPLTAVVSHICNPKEGNYGPYCSTLFESPDLGGDGRLWRSLPVGQAGKLAKGMTVQLQKTYRNGRETWDIIIPDAPQQAITKPEPSMPLSVPVQQQGVITDEEKRSIASYSQEMINLYAYLWAESKAVLESRGCTDVETIRTCTSSTFIAAQRKFNLA